MVRGIGRRFMNRNWTTLYFTVVLALRNVALHKLRSMLTISGLVFGVASVIAMLAIGEGASLEAQRQIEQLGATNIIVRSVKPLEEVQKKGSEESNLLQYGLTYDDLDRIQTTLPTAVAATPLREFRQEVRYLDRALEGRVVGATPDYADMNGLKTSQGNFLRDLDLSTCRNVCVLGAELAEKLFPYENPVGKSVRIGPNHYYRVIGVTGQRAPSAGIGTSLSAQDYNRDVYIPLSTDRVRFGETLSYGKQGTFTWEKLELSQITLECDSMDHVRPTAASLQCLLDEFHPRQDFTITVPLELLEQAEKTKRIFNVVLGSIGSISLLVGGIGIMNIMLATVTERTREIGIRRALGARRRDIIRQFMVETAVLSATGGLLGVALGMVVPDVVGRLSGITVSLSPGAPLVAFAVAMLVGVGFGLYPAQRAARMDPVEALRAE